MSLVQYIQQWYLIHLDGKDFNYYNNLHGDPFIFVLAMQRMVDHCGITYQTTGYKSHHDTRRCLPYLQRLFPLS
jgi:hypothetical protein